MANEVAKEGHLFVCLACGKTSHDRYGERKISRGWDESCMLNCDEFPVESLVYKDGRVVEVK